MSNERPPAEPQIIQRHCGGYLALSTSAQAPRIGVTADTEDEAKEKFHRAFTRWMEILDGSNEPACHAPPKLPIEQHLSTR